MDKSNNIISELLKYKGLIFDLDGTLVDLNVNWKILKERLTNYCSFKRGINIKFTSLNENILLAKTIFGEKFYLELLNIISDFEMKEENYQLNLKLIDYINSSLQKIAIYSMNTKRCIDNITKKYFKKEPDVVVSKNSCIEFKPTNKDLLEIIKIFELQREEVLFVGNSKEDELCGKMIGIKTLIV